jgi:hypothetical protein
MVPRTTLLAFLATFLLPAALLASGEEDLIEAVDPAALDTQTAADTGAPQERDVRTLIFRSLESPAVASHPKNCPFIGPNLFLGADLYSITERASDSEVVNETVQQIGTAAACGVLTLPLTPSSAVPFYIEFTLDNGPDRGDTFVAQGECLPASFNVPKRGVLLAGCVLKVLTGPQPFLGGAATSLSIFNLGRVSGVTTGSFWTLRAYSATQ